MGSRSPSCLESARLLAFRVIKRILTAGRLAALVSLKHVLEVAGRHSLHEHIFWILQDH